MMILMYFNLTRHVINVERWARQQSLAVTVIPLPAHISSQCGMGLMVSLADLEAMIHYCQTETIPYYTCSYEP